MPTTFDSTAALEYRAENRIRQPPTQNNQQQQQQQQQQQSIETDIKTFSFSTALTGG
jgi:hypothetical protein